MADESYHELYAYTMDRPKFILQHVADANTAQKLTEDSKPIAALFALAGLYLHLEKGFTGKEVQQAHMTMAKRKRDWPVMSLPAKRGDVTPEAVMAVPAGPERDAAIDRWCQSVWDAFAGNRDVIVGVLREYGII